MYQVYVQVKPPLYNKVLAPPHTHTHNSNPDYITDLPIDDLLHYRL